MGLDLKDIANAAKLSGLIVGTVATGGIGAAAAPILGAGGTFLEGLAGHHEDDDEEDAWKRKTFPAWIAKGLELAEAPMNDDARERTLRDLIEADWTTRYAKRPKKSVVDKLFGDVVFVVKAKIATSK